MSHSSNKHQQYCHCIVLAVVNAVTGVAGAISNLDNLLAEMSEAINEGVKEPVQEKKASDDLEEQLNDLTDKLKTALENGNVIEEKESLGLCSHCSKDIFENSLLVGEQTYHKECFTCHQCGEG